MTESESAKLRRIARFDAGICINGCKRPHALPCGLCRPCSIRQAASTKAWKQRRKLGI